MAASVRDHLRRLQVEEALLTHQGLRLCPSGGDHLTVAGNLHFRVQGPTKEVIEDTYAVRIKMPLESPQGLPKAWETGGRIAEDYHKLDDGALCLGAPTEQRMVLARSPTLPTFIEKLLIPYLFGYSYRARHGTSPFGELDHGQQGIVQAISGIFGSRVTPDATEFLYLASLRRRDANKLPCPCRSGHRLGRCHHRSVNSLRDRFGRAWFREEYARFLQRDGDRRSSGLPRSRKAI